MKRAITAFFILLAAAACLGQSEQPSLGDLAKQQRGEKKAAKVFTNEDVATHSTSPASDNTQRSGSAIATVNPSASADAKAEPEKKKDASAAKDAPAIKESPEVAKLKEKISSYKSEQAGWNRSAKRYQDLLATETSEFRRQMYQDALQGDQQNIQLYQNKIDQAEAELAKTEKSQSEK